jgi:putative hydrolase of the HAD superfamily
MQRPYNAIIFDLYGTLLDIHTDEDRPELWEKLAHFYALHGAYYQPNTIHAAYLAHVNALLEKRRNKGSDFPDIDILKVFKRLFKEANVKVGSQTLKEAARLFRILSLDYVTPYPGAITLLEALKAYDLKILLLSNAQTAFTMDELTATGLLPYFDSIYLSSDYQVCKPSPEYFNILLVKEGLTPEACLFIGNDHIADIAGASSVGIDSIYLHTNCSREDVPEVTGAKWSIDDGDLEVLKVLLEEQNIIND